MGATDPNPTPAACAAVQAEWAALARAGAEPAHVPAPVMGLELGPQVPAASQPHWTAEDVAAADASEAEP